MVEEDYAELKAEDDVVDEMTASIENGDMSLVCGYEEWYDYVGDKKYIPEYKIELQKTLNNISSNNEDTIDTITDEQVKELISKHENQMYEIKKELWECE